jgi:uncharacterized caspase-like protein
MGRNLAISIGINKYDCLTPLKYAKPDAHLMQEFLRNQVRCEEVLFYSDDSPDFKGRSTRPSFTNLNRVLRTMFEKPFMEAGDNFWFFFSGHGRRHNGCDYLMASDSDPGDIERTAISISYVTEQLRRCGADNVILILDACRDQGSKSGEGIGNQAADVARQKGVITFFSCSPHELSYEIETLQQGIFTKAVLEGLGIQGRCATVERLNHYLSARVPQLIREYKGEKVRQTPYVIAEPITKSHLIICPYYAVLLDVTTLKIDAYKAADNKDYELAKQLWIRILAVSPGDIDAINGIEKIAVLRIENKASPPSIVGSHMPKFMSPLSPKSAHTANNISTRVLPKKQSRTGRMPFPQSLPKMSNNMIWTLLTIAGILFGLLGYNYNTNLQKSQTETGLACYGASCTGKPPTYAGCDKGVETITSRLASFPDLGNDLQGKDLQNFDVEMRYSSRCNASWIKTPPVEKATIYFEDKAGKRYADLKIDPHIKEPQVTDMFFRNIESRGCIEYPGKKPQCTAFVAGQS